MNKYNNRKTICFQGHAHDSKKEAGYCDMLDLRKAAGDILDYKKGEPIELIPKFINSQGEKVRAMTYTPDFVIFNDGCTEIVDVKSDPNKLGKRASATQAWAIKWKLLQSKYQSDRGYKFTII